MVPTIQYVARYAGVSRSMPRTPEGSDVFDLDFAESGRIPVDHLVERGHRELPSVLYSRGVRVPDHRSVVGMFSEGFGRLLSPPYTAVETSPNKLGRMAVQALVQRMTSLAAASPWRVDLVAPQITDRGSTR